MIPFTPALLVAAANAFVGVGEEGGDNRGQMVELFLREVRQPPGQPWCAAFVYHVGYWSHYDHIARRSSWPLPATASCEELGKYAKPRKILMDEPAMGDVFLLYSKELKRFAHAGIIVSVNQKYEGKADTVYVCTTVEGNTNEDGSRNGTNTLSKTRRFSASADDGFVRWVDLELKLQAA